MNKILRHILIIVLAVVAQVTILPRLLVDPYQPNLLLSVVVCLGLKEPRRSWGAGAFFLGLLQDSFSGIYPGLHAFTYLLTFLTLREVAGRLYTDSAILIGITVFFATIITSAIGLVLLLLFSAAEGIFASMFYTLIPQAIVNAIGSLAVFALFRTGPRTEVPA